MNVSVQRAAKLPEAVPASEFHKRLDELLQRRPMGVFGGSPNAKFALDGLQINPYRGCHFSSESITASIPRFKILTIGDLFRGKPPVNNPLLTWHDAEAD